MGFSAKGRKRLKMEISSSDILGPRLNFEFAFNDADFSDRVLHIEIMADPLDSNSDSKGCDSTRKKQKLHLQNECSSSTIAEVKKYHISSSILAANSPFFYKLCKNGMRESQQKDATLRINKSEDSAMTELLKFMHNNTLNATTMPELLDVLIIADKFEVASCIRYCSALLQEKAMSFEAALLYLKLPSTVSVTESVRPLIDAAKDCLVALFKDIDDYQEEAMTLPLFAIEAVLGSDSLQVDLQDDVFEFILKWARAHYPDLEVRRTILTKHLAQLIPFPYMSYTKLKEVLVCPDFDHEQVSKLVLEALFRKAERPYAQLIDPYTNFNLKVQEFNDPQPRCIVYLELKKEMCANLFPSGRLESPSFCLGGRGFYLEARCWTKALHESFALFLYSAKGSDERFTIDYEYAVRKKSSKEFQNQWTGQCNDTQLWEDGWGCSDLFEIPWIDFVSDNSEYFVDGILHLRADLTMNSHYLF